MGLIFFKKCILKRVRTVGPNSIVIENFNLNCATTMSQTVYAVYCKYEYCIYLNKKKILDINMHTRWTNLARGCLLKNKWCRTRKMHEAVHIRAWGRTRTPHEAVHEPFYFPHFLLFKQYLEPKALCIWMHIVRKEFRSWIHYHQQWKLAFIALEWHMP